MPSSLLRPMGADALLPKRPHPAAPAKEPADPLAELQNLLAEFSVEEEEDFQEADFMPTEQMPVPVCVPIYDLSLPKKKGRKGWWIALIAVLLLFAVGFWQREWIAAFISTLF